MLKEFFRENRTCRSFDESRIVTREELRSLVELARLSPSTANIQPLSYRLVTGEEVKRVQPLTKWAGALPELSLPPEHHCPTAFIVICQDTDSFNGVERFQRDVGICALAISMGAFELGLASCMIGSFNKEKLSAVLELPSGFEPQLVIAIGKPDEARTIAPLKDGSTKYYRENGVHFVPKRELDDIIIE